MQHDDLSRLWQSQADGLPAHLEDMLMHVKTRSEKFDRKILRRDLAEAAAGVLVAFAAFYTAFQAPGWWPKLGAAVLTAAVAWVYGRLHRTRSAHAEPPGDLDLGERLRREIAKVDAQIDLMRRVATWYVTPLAVGGTIWVLSMIPAADLPARQTWILAGLLLLVCAAIFGFVGWGVVGLNRRALDSGLYPYRRELEEMLDGLGTA